MKKNQKTQRLLLFTLVFISASVTNACGHGDEDGHSNHHNHQNHAQVSCAGEDDLDTYVDGLSKESNAGHYTVTLLTMDPSPPTKGSVSLQLGIADANGESVEDATVSFEPIMPAHGHGSDPEMNPGVWGGSGYDVGPLTLQMPGYWEFQVKVSGTENDMAVFRFCVDG